MGTRRAVAGVLASEVGPLDELVRVVGVVLRAVVVMVLLDGVVTQTQTTVDLAVVVLLTVVVQEEQELPDKAMLVVILREQVGWVRVVEVRVLLV